ncbi:MAG: nuclear transport factor 2 family protein [Gemmatimonadota bacterium]
MTFLRLFAIAAAVCLPAASSAQTSAPANGSAEVREVVGRYLHGLKFNNVNDLKEAFWPEAKLYFTKRDGSLGQLSQEQWYRGFEGSAGKEEQGDLRIADMEVTGDIAMVKVVEDYATSRYVDYISLVKFGGRWWIVNKVYNASAR